MGLSSDQTRKVLVVILSLYSCLPLFGLAQSQLIRSMNADSCGDIICPRGDVLYDCSVPIHGSVIVWRMMPECERNGEQPDITFLFGDPLLSIVCNDGRKITVQGMTTSNGNRFVSTLNVTNITSSQTTECLFDDGSQEEPVGNNTVFTTAPARRVVNNQDLVLTLNQAIENCALIEYSVNSSSNCGLCDIVIGNMVNCTNVESECTVKIETYLCGILVNQTMPIDFMSPTTASSTTSSSSEGPDSSSQREITIIVVVTVTMAVILAFTLVVILTMIKIFKRTRKPLKQLPESPPIPLNQISDSHQPELPWWESVLDTLPVNQTRYVNAVCTHINSDHEEANEQLSVAVTGGAASTDGGKTTLPKGVQAVTKKALKEAAKQGGKAAVRAQRKQRIKRDMKGYVNKYVKKSLKKESAQNMGGSGEEEDEIYILEELHQFSGCWKGFYYQNGRSSDVECMLIIDRDGNMAGHGSDKACYTVFGKIDPDGNFTFNKQYSGGRMKNYKVIYSGSVEWRDQPILQGKWNIPSKDENDDFIIIAHNIGLEASVISLCCCSAKDVMVMDHDQKRGEIIDALSEILPDMSKEEFHSLSDQELINITGALIIDEDYSYG